MKKQKKLTIIRGNIPPTIGEPFILDGKKIGQISNVEKRKDGTHVAYVKAA